MLDDYDYENYDVDADQGYLVEDDDSVDYEQLVKDRLD